jgi:hypothetical protein
MRRFRFWRTASKWLGYSRNHRWIWNVGYYGDWLSKKPDIFHLSPAVRDARRVAPESTTRRPARSSTSARIFAGAGLEDDTLGAKSRPEAFLADYFVDTGKLRPVATKMIGYEAYLRKGPIILAANTGSTSSTRGKTAIPRSRRRFRATTAAISS